MNFSCVAGAIRGTCACGEVRSEGRERGGGGGGRERGGGNMRIEGWECHTKSSPVKKWYEDHFWQPKVVCPDHF